MTNITDFDTRILRPIRPVTVRMDTVLHVPNPDPFNITGSDPFTRRFYGNVDPDPDPFCKQADPFTSIWLIRRTGSQEIL